MSHITAAEIINKMALEALVSVLKPLILYKGQETQTGEKRLSIRKKERACDA